jgi:hypothetical protein
VSWFELNKGAIGPPIAHTAAAAGMFAAFGLSYVLGSMGHLSRNLSVVLILAIPFAIAREMVAQRTRNFEANEPKSDGES